MSMQLVCTSKNIWAELSYEFGPSCLINLGPSWHGPSFMRAEKVRAELVLAELSVILSFYPLTLDN